MNPIKFPLNTRVRITKGPQLGAHGYISMEHGPNAYNSHVKLDGGGMVWAPDNMLEALPVPEVGDRVSVRLRVGRWAAQEGHVVKVGPNGVTVDLDYESPTFHPSDLEVIEKLAPKPKRVVGLPLEAKDVKIGDKISVTTNDTMTSDVERVTTLTAVVGKIVERGFNGGILTFQTTGGNEFYSDSSTKREIVLLESIEEDDMYRDLSSMGTGSVIVFANKPGEPETDMAIKQEWEDSWNLVDGAKNRKPRTVGLVNIIKKKGVTYTVLVRNEIKVG